MCPTVVIAARQHLEAEALCASLAGQYTAEAVAEPQALYAAAAKADAVVIDADFSDCQGIDVLMDLVARLPLPVVMITPPDDPLCAIEALRAGAATYLVKSSGYLRSVPSAVLDAIRRVNEVSSLRDQIVALRQRVRELEQGAPADAEADAGADADTEAESVEQDVVPVAGMADEIASKLRSGEIVLPSYPRVALKLRTLMETDAGATEIGKLLMQDTGVSAKIMKTANAAVFANGKKVSTVEDAVNRIGLTSACNLAEMVANQSLYAVANAAYKPYFDELWAHTVATAHAAQILGQHIEKRAIPKLFSLGLLHDAGKLALLQVLAQIDPNGRRVAEATDVLALREFLAQHHVPLGVSLMQRWNFDNEFKNVAQYHEDLTLAQNLSRPLLIVHLANLLARSRGHGEPLADPALLDNAQSKAFFSLSNDDLVSIGEELDRAIEATKRMMR